MSRSVRYTVALLAVVALAISVPTIALAGSGSVQAAKKHKKKKKPKHSDRGLDLALIGNYLKSHFVPNANFAANAGHASTADNATNAVNAAALGGSAPSAFERADDILTAVVTNNGTTATVVRGTPATSATRLGAGDVIVTFNRDVSQCTWIATQGAPGNSFAPADFATVRRSSSTSTVEVATWSTTPAATDANFHLVVIC